MNLNIRRYQSGDESQICDVVKKDLLTINIRDYSEEAMIKLANSHNEDLIKKRAKIFHAYVITDGQKIVGVGMIGPYWDSLTESSLFTIFLDPDYIGHGLGRMIMETLENDEYFKRANRVEIPSSITSVEFYKHFGYHFKKNGHIVDKQGMYRIEKYPKEKVDYDINQYNMRPFIDNKYHNYKEFVCNIAKNNNYLINNLNNIWIIQINGQNIGFYDGQEIDENNYRIENICLIDEYQQQGIEDKIIKDIKELHKNKNIIINDILNTENKKIH